MLELTDREGDPDPWHFAVLELDFEGNRARLLTLHARTARNRDGTTTLEDLDDILEDLSSGPRGVHWRKLW